MHIGSKSIVTHARLMSNNEIKRHAKKEKGKNDHRRNRFKLYFHFFLTYDIIGLNWNIRKSVFNKFQDIYRTSEQRPDILD